MKLRFSCFLLFLLSAATICNAQKVRTPAPVLPPTWSQLLPASERFQLVMNDEAVLDKETGLVWERTPSSRDSWPNGDPEKSAYCANLAVGGRKGWRLPGTAELASLIDPSQTIPPMLPAGHPFQNVHSDVYAVAFTYSGVWISMPVSLETGDINYSHTPVYCWCVRGGNTK